MREVEGSEAKRELIAGALGKSRAQWNRIALPPDP